MATPNQTYAEATPEEKDLASRVNSFIGAEEAWNDPNLPEQRRLELFNAATIPQTFMLPGGRIYERAPANERYGAMLSRRQEMAGRNRVMRNQIAASEQIEEEQDEFEHLQPEFTNIVMDPRYADDPVARQEAVNDFIRKNPNALANPQMRDYMKEASTFVDAKQQYQATKYQLNRMARQDDLESRTSELKVEAETERLRRTVNDSKIARKAGETIMAKDTVTDQVSLGRMIAKMPAVDAQTKANLGKLNVSMIKSGNGKLFAETVGTYNNALHNLSVQGVILDNALAQAQKNAIARNPGLQGKDLEKAIANDPEYAKHAEKKIALNKSIAEFQKKAKEVIDGASGMNPEQAIVELGGLATMAGTVIANSEDSVIEAENYLKQRDKTIEDYKTRLELQKAQTDLQLKNVALKRALSLANPSKARLTRTLFNAAIRSEKVNWKKDKDIIELINNIQNAVNSGDIGSFVDLYGGTSSGTEGAGSTENSGGNSFGDL